MISKKLWTKAPGEFEIVICSSQAQYLNHWAMNNNDDIQLTKMIDTTTQLNI